MAKYLGLALEGHRCLRCRCGNSYEQILRMTNTNVLGDYCSGCGRHRSDLEEFVFEQVDLPMIQGRQVEAAQRDDESWVVGFAAEDPVVQAEIEADDDALIGLRDWVKSELGLDYMLNSFQIQQA